MKGRWEMLFHYHFWTPYVEETEEFYKSCGFHTSKKIGKYNGEFQTFHPPLTWDDFRDKNIVFRIIEVRKGNVNITFGYGKRVKFDHIGFLISKEEYHSICERAGQLQWKVNIGERRTFIQTAYGFRIELQTHFDVIDDNEDITQLHQLVIVTKKTGLKDDLTLLFEKEIPEIQHRLGDKVTIKQATLNKDATTFITDPNEVAVFL